MTASIVARAGGIEITAEGKLQFSLGSLGTIAADGFRLKILPRLLQDSATGMGGPVAASEYSPLNGYLWFI